MPKRSTANSQTLAPPILGINMVDPISGMDPMYAVEAMNFVARDSRVELREGEVNWATTNATQTGVGFIAEGFSSTGTAFWVATSYNPTTGAAGLAYNFTAGGVGASIDATGVYDTSNVAINYKGHLVWWVATDSASPGASFVFKRYDGTTLTSTAIVAVAPSPTAPPTNFATYRNRLWWAQKNSASIFATAVDSYPTGTEVAYNVSMLLEKGGNIAFVFSIARGGTLTDEYFVAVSFAGEVLVFQGTDYASTTWSITNRYTIPKPWGPKSFVKYGRDVLIMTVQGVVSISQIMEGGGEVAYVSEKITPIFNEAVWSSFNAHAGVMTWYPGRNLIICNLPTTAGTNYTNFEVCQLAMNTQNGSWWKWGMSGNPTACATLSGVVYWGRGGEIVKMTGAVLNTVIYSPSGVTVTLKTAYNYFGDRSINKQFVEARPIVRMSGGLVLTMGVDVDYKDVAPTTSVVDTSDTAYKLYTPRIGLQGIGRAASVWLEQLVSEKRISIEAIEVIWNDGDV